MIELAKILALDSIRTIEALIILTFGFSVLVQWFPIKMDCQTKRIS